MYLINWVAGLQMSRDCLSALNFSVQFVPRSVWRGSTWSWRRRSCLASASVFRWWFEKGGWRVHPSFWFKMKAPPRRDLFHAKRQPLPSAECTSISMITHSTLRHPTLSSSESIAQIFSCTQSAWFTLTCLYAIYDLHIAFKIDLY